MCHNSPQVKACLLASAALLALLESGCGKRDIIQFNDALVGAAKKLDSSGRVLGQALTSLDQGQRGVDGLKQASAQLTKTVQEVKSEVSSLKIPNSTAARSFHEGFMRYLKVEEEFIGKIDDIVKKVENKQLAATEVRNQVEQTLQQFGPREKAALIEVDGLQKAFAKEHNIRIK
jgi:uncharacterized phage infection (PIP) family protein YhgE